MYIVEDYRTTWRNDLGVSKSLPKVWNKPKRFLENLGWHETMDLDTHNRRYDVEIPKTARCIKYQIYSRVFVLFPSFQSAQLDVILSNQRRVCFEV